MLESLKRWMANKSDGPSGRSIPNWARQRGYLPKRVKDNDGVVVEGETNGIAWRLEWGAPQRAYLLDRELRLRIDLDLPAQLQMLITSRGLAEELEQAAYALFTQDMQTRIDSGMPEEMRWLAMFPRIQTVALKSLRNRFTAVASAAEPLAAWLTPELVGQLEGASNTWLSADAPLVLMTLRGRLYLRVEALQPDAAMLDGALALFEAAARGAVAAAERSSGDQPWASSGSSGTAWQSQLPQDDQDGPV